MKIYDFIPRFQTGPYPLSKILRKSMSLDPIAPILTDAHLEALDRRVCIILNSLRDCIHNNPVQRVIYTRDEF